MPLYEYRCSGCGDSFEKLVRNTSKPVEILCPSCGSDDVKKLLSTFATHTGGSRPVAPSSSCSTGGG